MSRRTIQSPGVEIREIDLTQRAAGPVGTSVFIAGFSNQGPTDEIFNVGSFSEFEEIYGKPTTAAERYFYHSARQVFNSDANVYVSRLPYGTSTGEEGKNRSALVYPVAPLNTASFSAVNTINDGYGSITLNMTDPRTAAWKSSFAAGASGSDSHYIEVVSKDSNDRTIYRTLSGSFLDDDEATPVTVNFSLVEEQARELGTLSAETIIRGEIFTNDNASDGYTAAAQGLSGAGYYLIGSPSLLELTETEYENILSENISWSNTGYLNSAVRAASGGTGDSYQRAGMIVLNTGGTTINNDYEGYYVGVTDNVNVNEATPFTAVGEAYTVTTAWDGREAAKSNSHGPGDFATIPTSRLGFTLSAGSTANDQNKDTVSHSLEKLSKFDIDGAAFIDTINIGVFKIRNTPFANSDVELTNFLAEGYTGSLNEYRTVQSENGGNKTSFFIGDVEDNSPNIKVLVNPYLSKHAGDWQSTTGEAPTKFVRTVATHTGVSANHAAIAQGFIDDAGTSAIRNQFGSYTQGLYPLGTFKNKNNTAKDKNIGSIPDKLDRIFNIASNVDLFNIDVAIEAGLGTVHSIATAASDNTFDDTAYVNVDGFFTTNENITDSTTRTYRDNYTTIFNRFETFARQTRKDHIFIADVFRPLLVQGADQKVLDDKNKFFSKHVYWPLRHQFGNTNSNFATVYANWAKVYDGVSGKQVWIPFSGVAAKMYAHTDANFAPWYAPAGFNRGVVTGINDIALNPTQRQRDQLYRIAINPITQFPAEGTIVFGQKTLQKKPTAFDRVNVRRTFLDLEKRTRQTLKYFVFEPNTFLTRNKVDNTLTPIFENAKQTEGVYDYLIVCDDRNNPGSVIDQNELRVDIYLKPVRAAEFILVNFYAVNTDVNFEEIAGQ